MKKLTIKDIALYGFSAIIVGALITVAVIFSFVKKTEELNYQYSSYEKLYENLFEFKYYTERLLTTHDLIKEKKYWVDSKNKFSNSISAVSISDENTKNTIIGFWNIINSEFFKIKQQLNNELFQAQNIMDKSMLRRLGEGLTSNDKSDYYIILSNLKNSIDYIKQYEEFLLDELRILKNKEQHNIYSKIDQTKFLGMMFAGIIIAAAVLFVYFIVKLIGKAENQLIKDDIILKAQTKEQSTLLSLFDKGNSVLFKWENNKLLNPTHVSDSIFELLEYTPNEFYENKISYVQCIYKDDLDIVKEELENTSILNQEICKHEAYRVVTKSGKIKWVLDYTLIVRDEKNMITHYLGNIYDITQEKAKEKELREKENLLAQQSKMAAMGEMLENIAHQWRQPLSVISTSASGMKLQKQFGALSDEVLLESIETIMNSTQFLSKTIDDFRDFFKPNKEKILFDVTKTLDKAISLLESKFKNMEIEIILNTKESMMYGLENEFIQVIVNILNNSKDALSNIELDEQKRLIFIDIEPVELNSCDSLDICKYCECIQIGIKDNAKGIPEDIINKIFEPYFTTKHQSQGTGIGLYMSEEIIVKHMLGSISVKNVEYEYESENYIGAQFDIILPISKQEAQKT